MLPKILINNVISKVKFTFSSTSKSSDLKSFIAKTQKVDLEKGIKSNYNSKEKASPYSLLKLESIRFLFQSFYMKFLAQWYIKLS